MNHPFLKNKALIFYTSTWIILAVLFGFGLHYFYGSGTKEAFIDSFIFNGIFLGLGLAYWFVVRYNSFDSSQILNLIASHMAAAALSVAGGVYLTIRLLKNILPQDEISSELLNASMVWRAGLGLLYYAVIILVYHLIKYYDDLNERNQQQTQLESMLKESELAMLKSQINPHFIFNSLNSIASLTITAPGQAREMVIKLSEFLRYSLGKENKQLNSLEEELANLLLYLEIEKVRFGDRLKVETDISEETKNLVLPNLILQPLIENAIKHGIYESLGDITIRVNASKKNGALRISMTNEFDPESISKQGKGIGLKNVRERLRVIYGVPKLVFTEANDNLFTVRLDIPQLSEK
jgi:two-component system LytT family sensor kinase